MKRKHHQQGSVVLQPRAKGPDVWIFRFKEGTVRRSQILGDIKALPTKSMAEEAADKYRPGIRHSGHSMNLADAIDKYLKDASHVRPHTLATKKALLHPVRARWGKETASFIQRNLMEVELWLNSLEKRQGGIYSQRAKRHIKGEMHCLFESIMRWGGMDIQRNPIQLLRIKGEPKKAAPQTIVTVEQYHKLRELTEPHISTMIMLSMCLGLRVSEVLGLRWENIDLEGKTLMVAGSSVGKDQANTKTLASHDDLPLHDEVVAGLRQWKKISGPMNGWVFESPLTGKPFHSGIAQRRHLVPAGKEVGIRSLGWHAFRHSYRNMMAELELPMEVQQRLMRHSDIRTTTQYGGRKNTTLRKHNASVVEMIGKKKA
jgi:integrase